MEREAELTNSELRLQLSKLIGTDSNKAWHVLALLLSLGRPARPTELASKCTLFYATPNFIEFLCSIPNSPLYLTPNYFVTVSASGYIAIVQFIANSHVTLNFRLRFGFELGFGDGFPRQKREAEDGLRTYYRKRKRMRFDNEYLLVAEKRVADDTVNPLALPGCSENASVKAYFPDGNWKRGVTEQSYDPPILAFDAWKPEKPIFRTSLLVNSSNKLFRSGPGNAEYGHEKETARLVDRSEVRSEDITGCQCNSHDYEGYTLFSVSEHKITEASPYPEINDLSVMQNSVLSKKAKMDHYSSTGLMNFVATPCLEEVQQLQPPKVQLPTVIHDYEPVVEGLKINERRQEEPSIKFFTGEYIGKFSVGTAKTDELPKIKLIENATECKKMVPFVEKGDSRMPLKSQITSLAYASSLGQNQQVKSSPKSKSDQKDAVNNTLKSIGKILQKGNSIHPPVKLQQPKKDRKSIPSKQQLQYNLGQNINAKGRRESFNKKQERSFVSANEQQEQRLLPDFESFVVEEEEGSGGYGTVYKARRKSDGMTFAVKCPHFNANRNHVYNELKMLERFGGKNFIIKYEGSFKSRKSDCLVLEHVEHDRPEVLKKDIDVSELQWYGYCMFRALSGLHKQGVIHRDVKPGNFLFNRKACKGYLIDFNLAMDLNLKYGTIGKTKGTRDDVSFNHVPLPQGKSPTPTKSKKVLPAKTLVEARQERGRVSKSLLLSKNMKKEAELLQPYNEVGSRNMIKSQGADGSGITSAKDATSNMTPSGENLREPLPCQGRRELISLVQEALQNANEKASVPVSKRKRVAAPPQQMDRKFVYLTPMPLHSAGVAVGGAGLLNNKDGKQNREGPCVGTKGFRAPEVLFRSLHQGPKVDVWSAGVTLLYLMIGRTPFVGDPDQNVKDIAKLRGSEDLWEVAKLHSRESSFPTDLFEMKSLPSTKLQDWCKMNTRRPDFLNAIPRSLFDLVDKCLTVNPRLRISAEEALRHEFFTPCHEALRKHRLARQGVRPDSASNLLSDGQFQTC